LVTRQSTTALSLETAGLASQVERLVVSANGRAGFLSDFLLPAQRIILTAAILIFSYRAIQHDAVLTLSLFLNCRPAMARPFRWRDLDLF